MMPQNKFEEFFREVSLKNQAGKRLEDIVFDMDYDDEWMPFLIELLPRMKEGEIENLIKILKSFKENNDKNNQKMLNSTKHLQENYIKNKANARRKALAEAIESNQINFIKNNIKNLT